MTQRQRISRLTPVSDVIARMRQIAPVAAREVRSAEAAACVLAHDVVIPESWPASAIAMRDGYAIRATLSLDASSYAPVAVAQTPINVGESLPPGTDAVAPHDAIAMIDGTPHLTAPLAAGDGVLAAGTDATAGLTMLHAGDTIGDAAAAAIAAMGIPFVRVRRPLVGIAQAKPPNNMTLAIASMLAALVEGHGALSTMADLEDAFTCGGCDVVFVIGGTGSGDEDDCVTRFAGHNDGLIHGIALANAETAAFADSECPVLLIPARIDAAMICTIALGIPLIDQLMSRNAYAPLTQTATLSRKIASGIGLTEIVPVSLSGDQAHPLASGYWPLHVTPHIGGYSIVSPESEGFPAGAQIKVYPLP